VEERIIKPTIEGLALEKIDYKGFIFFGLIKVNGEPVVIEYNARMGDPETEVVMMRIKSDFVDLLEGIACGNLQTKELVVDSRFVVTVMLVSGGYPGNYAKGEIITGFDRVKDSVIFHAGTRKDGDKILTDGGRVIAVSSFGKTKVEALSKSFYNAQQIAFDNKYFRTDIGFDL